MNRAQSRSSSSERCPRSRPNRFGDRAPRRAYGRAAAGSGRHLDKDRSECRASRAPCASCRTRSHGLGSFGVPQARIFVVAKRPCFGVLQGMPRVLAFAVIAARSVRVIARQAMVTPRGVFPARLHQHSFDDTRPCAGTEAAQAPKIDRDRFARERATILRLWPPQEAVEGLPAFLMRRREARASAALMQPTIREKTA